MSPKLPPTLENISLLTFSSIYPLLLVSLHTTTSPSPELEMIGKWELNPSLEQTPIPGAVLEWWGAAKSMSGTQSQRNSAGIPPLLQWLCWEWCQLSLWRAACPHLLLLLNQFFFFLFWTKSLRSVASCAQGHKQPFKKKALSSEIQAGNPPGCLPGLILSQSCVFLLCSTLKVGRESSKIDTKTCFKGTSCTGFLSPHPDQSSVSKIPPVEGGNRGNKVSSSPYLKLFTPFWCPVPFQ